MHHAPISIPTGNKRIRPPTDSARIISSGSAAMHSTYAMIFAKHHATLIAIFIIENNNQADKRKANIDRIICITPLFRYTFQNPIVVLKHIRFSDCHLVSVIILQAELDVRVASDLYCTIALVPYLPNTGWRFPPALHKQ